MNIYIKIEIYTREFESRFLTGLYAALEGYQVLIGDDELLKLVQKKKLSPGIILEKSITPTPTRINELKDYKKNGSVVTSIDEEGGILRDDIDIFLKSRFSEKTIKYTDKIFCWGLYDYLRLIKLFPKYKNKFIPTGNPRISLWHKKYLNLIGKKLKNIKKNVLISSNFGVGTTTKRLSEIIKYHEDSKYFSNKIFEKDFYNNMSDNLNLFFEFIKLIKYLVNHFPKINFILRPHPSESEINWKNCLPKKKNLLITKKNTHSYWINNSDIVIHNGCTGGVEAFAKNKKIIVYKPFKKKSVMEFSNQFGQIARDEIAVSAILKKTIQTSKIKKIQLKNKLFFRYGNFEKENFEKNIVEQWKRNTSTKLNKKNNLFFIKVINRFRFIKNKFFEPYMNEKFPPFNEQKIRDLLISFQKIDKNLKKVKFKLIGPKLLELCLEND